jgi:lipopolysaccharide assembly protein A
MTIRPDNPDDPQRTSPANSDPTPTDDLRPQPEQAPATQPDDEALPERSPSSTTPVQKQVPPSRAGAMWVALCATAVVLVALIVFLLQNTRSVQVSFLWMDGSAPLAITLLIAAVGAALITALLGTVRITQLRRVARKRPPAGRHR